MARSFAPPAVDIGAERARAILSNQGCARILFTAIIIAGVFAGGWHRPPCFDRATDLGFARSVRLAVP